MHKIRAADVQPRLPKKACQFLTCKFVNKRPKTQLISLYSLLFGHDLTFVTLVPCVVAMAMDELPITCPRNVFLTNEKLLWFLFSFFLLS